MEISNLNSKPTVLVASQVCNNCKLRKRKCTKELPSCALCTKLLLKCQYGSKDSPSQIVISHVITFGSRSSSIQSQGLSPSELSNTDDNSNWNAFSAFIAGLSQSARASSSNASIHSEITRIVLGIITLNNMSIPVLVSTYCRTIGAWLPIISRKGLNERSRTMSSDPSFEFATLMLAICLVIQAPRIDGLETDMHTKLYFETKTLIISALSSGPQSLELLQANTLLTIYEYGHGMRDASLISMAMCSRAGRLLLAKVIHQAQPQDTDIGRLWWGILILDRFMNVGVPLDEIYISTSSNLLDLPTADEILDTPRPAASTPSGRPAQAPLTEYGPFCRTAHSAVLLGHVLEFVTTTSHQTDSSLDRERVAFLDVSLQKLLMELLVLANYGWEECCAAIAGCLSALMTLHNFIYETAAHSAIDTSNESRQMAVMAMQSAVRIAADISVKFNLDRAFINIHALPVLTVFTLYQAALLEIKLADLAAFTGQRRNDLDCFRDTSKIFGERWNVGRPHVALIDQAMNERLESARPGLAS